MTKITIAGFGLSLAPGLQLALDADESGNPTIYIDPEYDADDAGGEVAFEPGPTLMELFAGRNPILEELAYTQCNCDECTSARGQPDGPDTAPEPMSPRERLIHDARMEVLSELGNNLTDEELLLFGTARANGQAMFLEFKASSEPF